MLEQYLYYPLCNSLPQFKQYFSLIFPVVPQIHPHDFVNPRVSEPLAIESISGLPQSHLHNQYVIFAFLEQSLPITVSFPNFCPVKSLSLPIVYHHLNHNKELFDFVVMISVHLSHVD